MRQRSPEPTPAAGIVDTLVFHEWPSPLTLTPYMSPAFRSWVERRGDVGGPVRLGGHWLHDHPEGRTLRAKSARERMDPSALSRALARETDLERVVLGYENALLGTAWAGHYAARALVQAANEWTLERWLPEDPRFFALILISTALPEEAAKEIRAWAPTSGWWVSPWAPTASAGRSGTRSTTRSTPRPRR
jgi:hypothetical protein